MGGREISMNDTEWNSLHIEVTEYLEADQTLDAGLRQVVELNLQIGNNNPNERVAALGALKALLKGRDGTPFRRGQKPSVPAAVRVSIDKICGVVEEADNQKGKVKVAVMIFGRSTPVELDFSQIDRG